MADRQKDTAAPTVYCDAGRVGCDLAAVEALLLLKLASRRAGCVFRLEHASKDLLELLAFTGLDDVLVE